MRISDWSSDVCSADLRSSGGQRRHGLDGAALSLRPARRRPRSEAAGAGGDRRPEPPARLEIGRASGGKEWVSKCRSRWSPVHYKQNNIQILNNTSHTTT